MLSYGSPYELLIWPAAAISLVMAWRFDFSAALAVAFGTALAVLIQFRSIPLAVVSGLTACLGAMLGLLALNRLEEWKPASSQLEFMLRLLSVSLLVIAPCDALVASALRAIIEPVGSIPLPLLWLHWWIIESLALALIAPALLVWLEMGQADGIDDSSTSTSIDLPSFAFAVALAGVLVALHTLGKHNWVASASFLVFPLCLWLAIRHPIKTTALTLPTILLPLIVAQAYGFRSTQITQTSLAQDSFQMSLLWLSAAVITGLMHSVVSDRQLTELRMGRQSKEDLSTGLLNDRGLLADFGDQLVSSQRTHFGLIGIHLSNFDRLTDLSGAITAIQLERSTAALLGTQPGTTTAARLSAGRYTLVIRAATVAEVRAVSRELYSQLNGQLFKTDNGSLRLQTVIAGLFIDQHTQISSEDSLSSLKDALAIAASVRDPQLFVEPLSQTMIDARRAHQEKIEHIREAIRDARIELFAQPILDPHAGDRHQSYEVLSRLRDNQGRLIQPPEFMPLATQAQMTTALDRAVIHKVFAWLADHPRALASTYKCSINLSGLTLSDPSISAYIRQQRNQYSIPTEKIVFEITESEAIRNPAAASRLVDELKEQGYGIALDDFGTGLATFEYLKRFPLDYLKIDGQFIRNLENNPIDEEIVLATIRVARRLKVKTIAEHVHSAEIMALLQELGVDHMQGYFIGEPQPIAQLFEAEEMARFAAI